MKNWHFTAEFSVKNSKWVTFLPNYIAQLLFSKFSTQEQTFNRTLQLWISNKTFRFRSKIFEFLTKIPSNSTKKRTKGNESEKMRFFSTRKKIETNSVMTDSIWTFSMRDTKSAQKNDAQKLRQSTQKDSRKPIKCWKPNLMDLLLIIPFNLFTITWL